LITVALWFPLPPSTTGAVSATYRTLTADAKSVAAAHVNELVELAAMVIRSGVEEGTFRTVDPVAAGRAVLVATSRFHHPVISVTVAAKRARSTAAVLGLCAGPWWRWCGD
jgi:hypothetical protein